MAIPSPEKQNHKIKIPTAVVAKIAEIVKVNVDFKFVKYQN